MKRAFLALVLLLAAWPAFARQDVLADPEPVPVPAQRSEGDVLAAIKAAFGKNHWVLEDESRGQLILSIQFGDHIAKVLASHDSGKVEISYLDSENLNYGEEDGQRLIHPRYNQLVAKVAADLQAYLADGVPPGADAQLPVDADDSAIVRGPVHGNHQILRGLNAYLFIVAVDGQPVRRKLWVKLKPGKHRLDFAYFAYRTTSSAHLWLVATPRAHYTADFTTDGRYLFAHLVDDATGREVGGVQGSMDEPRAAPPAPTPPPAEDQQGGTPI